MTAAIVIPARFGSTRFPGKPLARTTGKFLIQHVVEQAQKAALAQLVLVATDDPRIADAVHSFGGTAVMTSRHHPSGTDRIAEVIQRPEHGGIDIIVNVQGDEPEIDSHLIDDLIRSLTQTDAAIATASAPFDRPPSLPDIANPNIVKVVTDKDNVALYFSRSVIPHHRDAGGPPPSALPIYRKHLGIYAYRRAALLDLAAAPPSELEQIEKLEQLRALYLGMKIAVIKTNQAPHGIDTPEDYAAFVQRYNGAH